ncbi:hypothetical protein SAMN06297129_3324 [Pseudooceanicola antarcticus]|nr:hypothetical protein SAMN06297129_3324 [Pseudooceanicola antarcticus]
MLPDAALEALFAEARDVEAPKAAGADDLGLPPGLSARILGDADQLQSDRAAEEAARRQRLRATAGGSAPLAAAGLVPAGAGMGQGVLSGLGGGFWGQLSRALGGLPALAGLGAVAVAGLWIGVMPPDALESSLETLLGSSVSSNPYLVDSTTAFDFLDSEG